MSKAKKGDKVKVHYTGKFNDGTVFDSSKDKEPLQFIIGDGTIIPGFEKAVSGMEINESKTITIVKDEAYGPHRDDMVATVERERLPKDINIKVGQQLQIPQENGRAIIVRITDIKKDKVTLDANHPLAGKDLVFDIQLVEIA
ncbi:MAG: peptidylprolyl isomerase [Spirochaetes bacterium]|nr:peptidylprolyl isomerase [Spirochaetota bacterium]